MYLKNEYWLVALENLYKACKTSPQYIKVHIDYCDYVMKCNNLSYEPLPFVEYQKTRNQEKLHIEPINRQDFGDSLTEMFGDEFPTRVEGQKNFSSD